MQKPYFCNEMCPCVYSKFDDLFFIQKCKIAEHALLTAHSCATGYIDAVKAFFFLGTWEKKKIPRALWGILVRTFNIGM